MELQNNFLKLKSKKVSNQKLKQIGTKKSSKFGNNFSGSIS